MLKKVLPTIILFGALLVGCNNNQAIEEYDTTPTNNVERDRLNNDVNPDDNIMIEERGDKSQVEMIEDFNRKNQVE